MLLVDLIIISTIVGFGGYLLATFFAWESGPFNIFSWLRGLTVPQTKLAQWAYCPICQGPLWVAILTVTFFLVYVGGAYRYMPVVWIAGTGLEAFLARVGVPDRGTFEVMKTFELERYSMHQDAVTARQLRRQAANNRQGVVLPSLPPKE